MYLLDSNILIYYLAGHDEVISFVENYKSTSFISVISVTELLAKPLITKQQKVLIHNFLDQFNVLDFDISLAHEAASLKSAYGLTFPDAVIAATAKLFLLQLVSKDKVFQKVTEIKTIYPK